MNEQLKALRETFEYLRKEIDEAIFVIDQLLSAEANKQGRSAQRSSDAEDRIVDLIESMMVANNTAADHLKKRAITQTEVARVSGAGRPVIKRVFDRMTDRIAAHHERHGLENLHNGVASKKAKASAK